MFEMLKKFKMNLKLKVLMVGIIMSILVSGCVEKPPQNGDSANTSSSAPFFPVQKESIASSMDALLSDKPEELELVGVCLRVNNGYDNYLLVWPYGFSVSTEGGVIQIIDDSGQPIMRVGDKIKLGGGEMPGERIAQYSAELPSDRCSGPYWIIGEVLTVDKSTSPVATTPALKSAPSQYISGQAFDGASGILTKKWDAENFAGFWRDPEANVSTETLVINQSTLNDDHRVIEKYNLIYTTKSIPLKYQVYMHVNKTPPGTEGFYSAIGWQGEKYALLQGNRIARIVFEQNTTDIKTMRIGESWGFGEGYRLFANSIDVPLRGEEQAWITFFKGNSNLDDKVLPNNYMYSYIWNVNDSLPVFLTYISNIRRLPYTDAADFRYTWLRSQNITEIKEGDVFGIMEVTSVKNSNIELRNKDPIGLAPGNTIHLMGDISIHVGDSETELLFYPAKLKNLDMLPPVNQTPPSNATIPPYITSIQPNAGAIGTKVVITGTGFTARDNNVAFRLMSEDSPEAFKVGYINNLISRDGKTIEFVVPDTLGACAFPLPENVGGPIIACPAIALLFKPGTHTYPVFIVNQNGTSNSINFTVSR